MSRFVEGIVNRIYEGYRFALKEEDGSWNDYTVVGTSKIRKNYNYLIKDDHGKVFKLNRKVALVWMESGDMKVYSS